MYPGEFNGYIGFSGFGLDAPLTDAGTLDLTYNEGYTYWTDFLFQGMFAGADGASQPYWGCERARLNAGHRIGIRPIVKDPVASRTETDRPIE